MYSNAFTKVFLLISGIGNRLRLAVKAFMDIFEGFWSIITRMANIFWLLYLPIVLFDEVADWVVIISHKHNCL